MTELRETGFEGINDVPGSTGDDWDAGAQLQRAMGISPEMSGTRREFVRQAMRLRRNGYTLAVLRPHLGVGDAVWAVNQVYDPHVSHGFEPVAFFSTEANAKAYRDVCEARQVEHFRTHAEYYKTSTRHEYEFAVEEWAVDDPELLCAIAGRDEGGSAEGEG